MNLIETSSPPTAALPIDAFADHLRLGRGFADDGAQDTLLEALLRAALAAIEARTGKAILEHGYEWELSRWIGEDRQGLPVGPVGQITSVTMVEASGAETVVDAGEYRLHKDLYRPELRAARLPAIPQDGFVRIAFLAGFGPDWADVPADMQQAVLMLAASYYEHRDQAGDAGFSLPFSVLSLIDKYRTVRVLGDRL